MVATSGDRLLTPDAVDQLRRLLIPRALVVTPNLPEAAALLDTPIADGRGGDARTRPQRMLELGAKAVLIKGGHDDGRRERRPAGRAERDDALVRRTHRHAQHPRHRLHAVVGDRGGARQGP